MRFGEPWAFLALILVPLVFLGYVLGERRRKRLLAAAGSVELLEEMALAGREAGATARLAQAICFAVALCFVVVALARPQFGMRSETRKSRGMDVVIALDLSRSMLARDVVPSRLERAKIELKGLIEELRGDRVGLVGFTSVALPLSPLTVDHSAVLLQLDAATPDDLPRGGTAIGDAITAAKRALDASKVKDSAKAIVIVTDGENHKGDAESVAADAKKAGIEVHVIGVGSRTGEPIPVYDAKGNLNGYVKDKSGQTVVSRLGEETLEAIATAGGGLVALPGSSGGLDLTPVAAHLARLKKAELQDRTIRVYEERYQWVLVPALLFLLLGTLIRPTRPRVRLVLKGLVVLAIHLSAARALAAPFEADDPDVSKGNKALTEGRAADAVESYQEAEKHLGHDPRLAFDRGLAEAARGELDTAIGELQRALEGSSDPNLRLRAAFALGNAYRKLKKYDDAIGAYRRSLLEDPRLSGARRNLEIAQSLKRIQEAQPKDPNQKNDDQNQPPPNDQDAGPPDGGQQPDAGDGDGGASDAGVGDGGSGDGGGSQGSEDGGFRESERRWRRVLGRRRRGRDAGRGFRWTSRGEAARAEGRGPGQAEGRAAPRRARGAREDAGAEEADGEAAPRSRREGLVMRVFSMIAVLGTALVFAPAARAEGAMLTLDATLSDTSVLVGDIVTVQITAVAKADGSVDIRPPAIDGLTEVSRSQSEGTSISWTNAGQSITREVTLSIEYQADKPGQITIPPFTARLGQYEAKTKATALVVTGSSAPAATPAEAGAVAPPEGAERTLFVRYRVDRAKAYLGQQILMDMEIFAQPGSGFSVEDVGGPPELDGFWKEVVDQPKRLNRTVETVAGHRYDVYRVWRVALFPLAKGKKTIPPAAVSFSTGRSLFSSGRRIRRQTAPLELDIQPLPTEGRPSDFSNNNVGQYALKASVDHTTVPAGKAVVLKLELSGRGNVKNARLPEVGDIQGFRVFPPTVTDKVDSSLAGIKGAKQAEILLMPLVGGRLEIPAFDLTIFDPDTSEYRRLTTESIRIAVEGDPSAEMGHTTEPPGGISEREPERIARSSLKPLRFRSRLSKSAPPVWRRPQLALMLAGPPLLFGLALLAEALRARARRDTPTSRKRAASRRARERLSAAAQAAEAGRVAEAYGELREAILDLGSTKLGVALQGLTIEQIDAAMAARGAEEALRRDVTAALESADYARFGMGERRADLPGWAELLEQLDTWTPAEVKA